MNRNLFYVESPFQLLCAYEAHSHFKVNDSVLIVRLSGRKENDEQLLKLIVQFGGVYKKRAIIKFPSSSSNLFYILRCILSLVANGLIFMRYERVFLGSHRSRLFNTLKKNIFSLKNSKTILLDDGNVTIDIQSNFDSKDVLDLFTIYDLNPLPSQTIYKNTFRFVRKHLELKRNENKKCVIFLGAALDIVKVINQDAYHVYLKKIFEYFASQEVSVLFIPHRLESSQTINMIENSEVCQIMRLDYPVELIGIYEELSFSCVASFYSTALITMNILYGVKSMAFKLLSDNPKYSEEVESVYRYYDQIIDVIDIEKL